MILWTENHLKTLLPSLIIMAIASVVLRKCLKDKSEKIRLIPLQVIAVIIVVLEIFKQVISFTKGYDLYHIPLHFCSLFIFFYPLAAFYKGKYKESIRAFTSAISFALFLLMTIYPDLIYSGNNIANTFKHFFDFHTVVFHTVATFGAFVIVSLDLHQPETKKDTKNVYIILFVYCLVAGVVSQILKTNYNNFYHCNVPPLENLRVSVVSALGGFGQALYVIVVTIADFAFVTGAYWLYRGIRKLFQKI